MLLVLYRGYIGIMEKELQPTAFYWDYRGVISG